SIQEAGELAARPSRAVGNVCTGPRPHAPVTHARQGADKHSPWPRERLTCVGFVDRRNQGDSRNLRRPDTPKAISFLALRASGSSTEVPFKTPWENRGSFGRTVEGILKRGGFSMVGILPPCS